jgi:hypothetical protein
MTRAAFVGVAFLMFVLCGIAAPVISGQEDSGWTPLFDGTNLNNWAAVGNANWRLADKVVEANMGAGFLVSRQLYNDFDLRVEFWMSGNANSGVFIRCQKPTEIGADSCYEINAFDTRPDPAYRTGGIVDIAKPLIMINAGDKWNTFDISAKGPKLTVRLNGMLTAEAMDAKLTRGNIALQAGAGTVRFRSVLIK